MAISDPIGQMLTQIRNALKAGHATVDVPLSGEKRGLASVLQEEGYIESVLVLQDSLPGMLRLTLKYTPEKEPVIRKITRVSRPGFRRYAGTREIPRPMNGLGTVILSTPQGIKSGKAARKMRVGGEILCTVW